jgi:4-hydroxyphenylpyruvate dioxygenase-like putative hemolysin
MSARESWTKRRAQRPEREEVAVSDTRAVTEPMNTAHRCDRCGAQAYVRVLLPSRQDVLFCAHHYRQHAPALAGMAIAIQDETHRLARDDWPGSPG